MRNYERQGLLHSLFSFFINDIYKHKADKFSFHVYHHVIAIYTLLISLLTRG